MHAQMIIKLAPGQDGEDDPSSASSSYLRHSVQLISIHGSPAVECVHAASMRVLPRPSTVR